MTCKNCTSINPRFEGKTEEEIKKIFLEEFLVHAKKMYHNSKLIDDATFTIKFRDKGFFMTLAYARNVGWDNRAFGDTLFRLPKHLTLYIHRDVLTWDDEAIKKIFIHEAGHLGYPRHDKDFIEIVERNHGAVSMRHGEGYDTWVIQVKEKGTRKRYRDTEYEFDDIGDAREFVRDNKDKLFSGMDIRFVR